MMTCANCMKPETGLETQLSDHKVFVFEHTGVWLPGFTAVVARTEDEARAKLQARWAVGYTPTRNNHTPNIYEKPIVIDLQGEQVVEIWNGDY